LGVLFDPARVIALATVEDEYAFCHYPFSSISPTSTIRSQLHTPRVAGPHHVSAYIFLVFLSKGVYRRRLYIYVFVGVRGINFHTMIQKNGRRNGQS
jgi:hypothetical protein